MVKTLRDSLINGAPRGPIFPMDVMQLYQKETATAIRAAQIDIQGASSDYPFGRLLSSRASYLHDCA